MLTNPQCLSIANELYSQVFSGQTINTIVLTEYGREDPMTGVKAVTATDTITVARVYDFKNYERASDSIGLTDYNVGFPANPLNCTINKSLSCTVNGTEVNIVAVAISETKSEWTLQVHDK